MSIVDGADNELPWDGKKFGRLKVRGLAVVKSYFQGEGGEILDKDGFFDTGDVATIDPEGYMQITDRAKDVIKSGGEWISSIDIENFAVGHPDVAEAAVIGIHIPSGTSGRCSSSCPRKAGRRTREDVLEYPEAEDRQMVDARRHAGGQGNSAHRDRQDQQAEAARDVQGL